MVDKLLIVFVLVVVALVAPTFVQQIATPTIIEDIIDPSRDSVMDDTNDAVKVNAVTASTEGTDETAGPATAVSIGGTETDGTFQELLMDSNGQPQVEVTNTPTVVQSDQQDDDGTIAGALTVPFEVSGLYSWDGANWERVATATGNIGNNDADTTRTVESQVLSFFDDDLDETAVAVATGASELCGFWVTNQASTTRWVKFYNVAQGSVTVGTTNETIDIGIPGNSTDDVAGNLGIHGCVDFGTALTVAATTGLGTNGAPSANDVVITVFYRE